jgi:plastocyanin
LYLNYSKIFVIYSDSFHSFTIIIKELKMCRFINHYLYIAVVAMCFLIFGFYNTKDIIAAYEEGDVSNGGTITGTVKFAGDVPEAKMLNVDKDQKTCGHDPIPSEALLVSSDKTVKTAVVSISGISKGKKFGSRSATLDQKGCVFIPHVSLVPQGGTVNLLNSDDVMHNLHSWSMKNTAFNEGVAGGGKLLKTFEHPETIKITCDVHKWMSSWLIVQDNPYYAITDKNGNFRLEDVPPGTYTLEAWQESLGKVAQEVTVKSGEATRADFEMEQREKKQRRRREVK